MAAEPSRGVVAWPACRWTGARAGRAVRAHDRWLYEHAGHEQTSSYFEGIWRGASTTLLGRTNYEGFLSVWRPP